MYCSLYNLCRMWQKPESQKQKLIISCINLCYMKKRYTKQNIVYFLLDHASNAIRKITHRKRNVLVLLILGIFFFFFAIRFKRIFFTCFLIGLGSVSMLY